MTGKRYFAKAPIKELMKESGAEMIAGAAVDEVIANLTNITKETVKKALEFKRHSGRKKLTKDDIVLAFKE